jgi:hypothetical protein
MQVREHHGFGHGLTPGTTEDINCVSCKREKAEGAEPHITGYDRPRRALGPETAAHCRAHIQFRSDCDGCVSARELGG